ncbi:MAG: hypothetical protein RBS07_12255 [Lentimicrobium sp.]|jgi:hypothetical protein|nr:hypothetical protein [Lentimicrobium sp.]
MKKWNFLFMSLLMSAAVMVSSCGSDDEEVDPGPSINLKGGTGYTSENDTIRVNTAITVGVTGLKSSVSGQKLTRFKFSITSNNIATTFVDSTISSDSFTWETDLTFTGVGQARLLFELWDKGGMSNQQSFDLVIEDPGTAINKFVDVEFGSWNDAIGSFFSSTEGITYTVGQTSTSPLNQAKIDFLFFYGATNKNTMASPDDADANTINDLKLNLWTNKNQTRFNSTNITTAQFDAIGTTYQFPTFNFSSQTTKVNMLAVGDIFLFKTQTNKLGLVKINYLSTPNKGDKSRATIIIQK